MCYTAWIVIGAALLVANLVCLVFALRKLNTIDDLSNRMDDKSSAASSRLNKIEAAVEWWLQKEGMRLELSSYPWSSCMQRWAVLPTRDETLRDWFMRTEERKKEALADALYKASIQAMRDFDNETKKANKK